jgi:hypothetical protein
MIDLKLFKEALRIFFCWKRIAEMTNIKDVQQFLIIISN